MTGSGMPANPGSVLEIDGLRIALPPDGDRRQALTDVAVAVGRGEIVCLVGESGSGKSVIAFSAMGLLPQGAADQRRLDPAGRRGTGRHRRNAGCAALRGNEMGMIFQEPMTALNPVMRCGDQIDEVLREHTKLARPSAGAGSWR